MAGENSLLARWHQILEAGSKPGDLNSILSEDAVFHSPVVHAPQKGRPLVVAYLVAASKTLGNESFHYTREVVSRNVAVLEFKAVIDGIEINGVDIITFNKKGMITDFKVMVRPLKAINKVWEMMGRELERQQSS